MHAVRDDPIPKEPKTSLYPGLLSSLSSLSLGSSNGVRGLLSCSSATFSVVAIMAVANGIVSLGLDGSSVQDGGQVGSPLCSRRIKLIPGSGWFLSPSSFQASRKHSNLFP